MFPLPRAALAAALAALVALPACDKKKPAAPDTDPPPVTDPKPDPKKDPKTGDPNPSVIPGLPAPPTQRPLFGAAAAQARADSAGNLKQIAVGFHNAQAAVNGFPAGVGAKGGKVGLSWRVALLPYLEHDGLYRQFKLDEPWDSEHNKKLIPAMPRVYAPGKSADTNGHTFYRSFSGPGTALAPRGGPVQPGQPVVGAALFAIPDGTANTFLVVEAYDPVIWTKPDELPFAPKGKLPRVGGGVFGTGFHAAFCDGSVRFLSGLDDVNLARAIQTADGEVVNFP